MASFFKKIIKVVHPLSRLFLKDKKKAAPGDPGERPEDIQQQYEDELKSYGGIDERTSSGAIERAKTAGTYAPTAAFKEQAAAESGAAARQLKGESQAKVEALKKRYAELVASDPKKYKGMSPSLGAEAPKGTI